MFKSVSYPGLECTSSDDDSEPRPKLRKSLSIDTFTKVSMIDRNIRYKYKLPEFSWDINHSDEANCTTLRTYDPYFIDIGEEEESRIEEFMVCIGIYTQSEIDLHKFRIQLATGTDPEIDIPKVYESIIRKTAIKGLNRSIHLYLFTLIYCHVMSNVDKKYLPKLTRNINFIEETSHKDKGTNANFFSKLRIYLGKYQDDVMMGNNLQEDTVSEGYPYILSLIYLRWEIRSLNSTKESTFVDSLNKT